MCMHVCMYVSVYRLYMYCMCNCIFRSVHPPTPMMYVPPIFLDNPLTTKHPCTLADIPENMSLRLYLKMRCVYISFFRRPDWYPNISPRTFSPHTPLHTDQLCSIGSDNLTNPTFILKNLMSFNNREGR